MWLSTSFFTQILFFPVVQIFNFLCFCLYLILKCMSTCCLLLWWFFFFISMHWEEILVTYNFTSYSFFLSENTTCVYACVRRGLLSIVYVQNVLWFVYSFLPFYLVSISSCLSTFHFLQVFFFFCFTLLSEYWTARLIHIFIYVTSMWHDECLSKCVLVSSHYMLMMMPFFFLLVQGGWEFEEAIHTT